MLIAFLYGAATWRQTREAPEAAAVPDLKLATRGRPGISRGSVRRPTVKRGFMQRFEDRWDHRREGLGRDGSDERLRLNRRTGQSKSWSRAISRGVLLRRPICAAAFAHGIRDSVRPIDHPIRSGRGDRLVDEGARRARTRRPG